MIFILSKNTGYRHQQYKSQIIIEFSLIFMNVCVLQCAQKLYLSTTDPQSGHSGNTCFGFVKLVVLPYLFESRHCGQKTNLAKMVV